VREQAPGLTLVFRPEGEEEVDALRDGRIDLDIGAQGTLGPEIRKRKLLDDERVVLVRRRRARTPPRLTVERLAAEEHVEVSRRGREREALDELLARRGLTRRVRAVVPNQLAAALLVAQSDLVSLLSKRFSIAMRDTLDVDYLPCPLPLGLVRIELAWHPRFEADPVHAWLREQVTELARELGPSPRLSARRARR